MVTGILQRGILCLICFLIFFIILLINRIRIYFIEKEALVKSEKLVNVKEAASSDSIAEKVESSAALLALVDKLIELEVDQNIAFIRFMKKKYNMLNLDNDVKNLGDKIFGSIKKEILSDTDLIITTDYLMQYIVSQCTLVFTAKVKEYNITIAAKEATSRE